MTGEARGGKCVSLSLSINSLPCMMYITEWTPTFPVQVICGHTISAGQKACKLTISVCRDDVACLPQAIKAALNTPPQQGKTSSFLFRLWHRCFGTRPKKTPVRQNAPGRMRKCVARRKLRLDCGHIVKAGSAVWENRLYTCQQEGEWSPAVLAACLRVLQQKQAASQPESVNKTYAAKNIYTFKGQPSAYPLRTI